MKNNKKIIAGALIVFLITGGAVSAALADSSISGMLSDWLSHKSDQAIVEIDEEIQKEQAEQTERLKAEIDKSLEEFEAVMNSFVEAEKEKRILAIEAYAAELISEVDMNETERKAEIEKELERIFDNAIQEMDQLNTSEQVQIEEEQKDTIE